MAEIREIKPRGVKILMDSQSAIQLAMKEGYNDKTRHIGVQHHFLRDLVDSGLVCLEWVSTNDMVADIFTKALDKRAFERIRSAIMDNVMGECWKR